MYFSWRITRRPHPLTLKSHDVPMFKCLQHRRQLWYIVAAGVSIMVLVFVGSLVRLRAAVFGLSFIILAGWV